MKTPTKYQHGISDIDSLSEIIALAFLAGADREQPLLLPPSIDEYVSDGAVVRVIDAFAGSLDLLKLSFEGTILATTGRPAYNPADMLKLLSTAT